MHSNFQAAQTAFVQKAIRRAFWFEVFVNVTSVLVAITVVYALYAGVTTL